MYFIYIDDSGDENTSIFTALVIPVENWRKTFWQIRYMRRELFKKYGIFINKELHATEFLAGKGGYTRRRFSKKRLAQIYMRVIQEIATLPEAMMFNVVLHKKDDVRAFDRLYDGIDEMMREQKNYALLFMDEGNNRTFTQIIRKKRKANHEKHMREKSNIESQEPEGGIIEDPIFKNSRSSYFIQLADFAAYALLRKERPIPSKTKYGLDKIFPLLSSILVMGANKNDSLGIIRE